MKLIWWRDPIKCLSKASTPNFLSLSGKLRNSNLKLQKAIEPGNPLIFNFFPFDKKCLTYYIEIFIIKKKGLFFYDLKTNGELAFQCTQPRVSPNSSICVFHVYYLISNFSIHLTLLKHFLSLCECHHTLSSSDHLESFLPVWPHIQTSRIFSPCLFSVSSPWM